MGDRTYVKITIHTDYMDKLLAKYGSEEKLRQEVDADGIFADEGAFEASEVNYANWDTLENLLKEEEIEFNKEWGPGCEYSEGEAYYRKVGKEFKFVELYSSSIKLADELEKILNSKNPLKEAKKKLKELRPFKIEPLARCPNNAEKFIEKLEALEEKKAEVSKAPPSPAVSG